MKTSRQFYTELKAEGLVEIKQKNHTIKEITYLKKLLNKKQKILDLACCGYGRFTIPLAIDGYNIEGVDITPALIKKAKETVRELKLKTNFKIGDMRKISYKDKSFDVILCMWGAFIELTKKAEQIKSIREMYKVLKNKGFAVLEMPLPLNKFKRKDKGKDDFRISRGKLIFGIIAGIEAMPTYIHDKKSLAELMRIAKIKKYKIFIDNFGGRERLFLIFWKT